MRNAPSRCVLSFCEVSLKLLRWYLGCCWDAVLAADLVAALALGVGGWVMCAAHLLVVFCLSVEFCQISFGSLWAAQFWAQFGLWPGCGLGLRRGSLALARDAPSRCVLSFCEVSLNLLQ